MCPSANLWTSPTSPWPPKSRSHNRPVVRLRPKAEARAVRLGFPWVYADELVTDRRTSALAPGALAVLEDGDRRQIGLVTVNAQPKIIARLLDRDVGAQIDEDWFAACLTTALALRERMHDSPFYRLVHAEADAMPGVIIDRFGDAAVIQPNAAWAEAHVDALASALRRVTGVTTVIKNGTGRARGLEGLKEETLLMSGALTGPIAVPMNGATYLASILGVARKPGCFMTSVRTTPLPQGSPKARGYWTCSLMSAALPWRPWRAGRKVPWLSTLQRQP